MARLGSCLLPFVPAPELKEALSSYADEFNSAHLDWCRRKLGLRAWRGDDDEALVRGVDYATLHLGRRPPGLPGLSPHADALPCDVVLV